MQDIRRNACAGSGGFLYQRHRPEKTLLEYSLSWRSPCAPPCDQQALYAALITELVNDGAALLRGGALASSQHRVASSPQQMQQWSQLEQAFSAAESAVPLRSELQKLSGLSEKELHDALRGVVKLGDVRQITDKRYARPHQLQA